MSQKLTHSKKDQRAKNYTRFAALSEHMMRDLGKCFKFIEIYNPKNHGENSTAMIVDTCKDCEKHSINVSQNVFEIFTPDVKGRRKVRWEPGHLSEIMLHYYPTEEEWRNRWREFH